MTLFELDSRKLFRLSRLDSRAFPAAAQPEQPRAHVISQRCPRPSPSAASASACGAKDRGGSGSAQQHDIRLSRLKANIRRSSDFTCRSIQTTSREQRASGGLQRSARARSLCSAGCGRSPNNGLHYPGDAAAACTSNHGE